MEKLNDQMMKCPNCKTEFDVVQEQIIRDRHNTVESRQIYCPNCGLTIVNSPKKLHEEEGE